MEGYMKDAQGRLVPVESIKPVDLLRDQLVKETVEKAAAMQQQLVTLKRAIIGDLKAFVAASVEQYGVKYGGIKGNVQLATFDGDLMVQLAVQDRLVFDERLHAAKALIDECLREWTKDSLPPVRALIDQAFQVDKAGRINTARVLGLRKLNIDDARWKSAMDAITDSLTVDESKEYVRFYRKGRDGEYELIDLRLSA